MSDIAETLRFLLMGATEAKETETPEVPETFECHIVVQQKLRTYLYL